MPTNKADNCVSCLCDLGFPAHLLRDSVRLAGVHEDGEVHVDVCGGPVPAQHDRCRFLLRQTQLPALLFTGLG